MALIISVLHNFANIFIHILYSFAYFSQSRTSGIVHLLYWNDTFSTSLVSFVYRLPRILSILAIHRFPACPLSCGRSPFSSPERSRAELLHTVGRTFPQHKNSGARPGLPLSAASIFFLLTGPIQASRHPALVSSRHGPL